MMGKQQIPQRSLFHYGININKRVRSNHPLRKVSELIDFDFIYQEVNECYGHNGNVSVPPPVILKLMLLLIFYNVRSERELMETIPERIDWPWFLDFDLDSEIPNHSVLSKARKKWGSEVFKSFFERIVIQCVEAGLVDGSKIFMDSSLIDANASNDSVLDTKSLKHQLHENYRKLEARLEEKNESTDPSRRYVKQNSRFISATDPDAAIVNRGKSKLSYQVHRAVDERTEIITATEATAGDINEAHRLMPLIERHNATTGLTAHTAVADSKYGTIDNFLACCDKGINAHIPDLREIAEKRTTKEIFSQQQFQYDPQNDLYRCPAGNVLNPRSVHLKRESQDYGAPKKVCAVCPLREQCTTNKSGRTVKRHLRQEELERMREASRSSKSKRDLRTRQHLMERSFARSKRYGYDRARWRGLWRMRIQEYLVCAIQNIQALVKYGAMPKKSVAIALTPVKNTLTKATNWAFVSMHNLIHRIEHTLPFLIMNPAYTGV
jgi:transposase